MTSKLALNLLAVCGLVLAPAVTYAASHNAQGEEREENSKVRTVKGCLEKSGDEYQVRMNDGSTWELKADGMNLADHVGQTVRVTGTVNHEKMHDAKEKAKEKTGNDAPEHGHLTVTDLKATGHSCSR